MVIQYNTSVIYFDFIQSPIGPIKVESSDEAVISIEFLFGTHEKQAKTNHLTDDAVFQLNQYFKGHLTEFDLPLHQSGSEFQLSVWKKLEEIPFGHTITYGELAQKIGDPNKVRAVGAANGKNLFAIVVPCHRVIGLGGQLVGYAGGLQRKQWLLNFEKKAISKQTSLF